MQLSYVPHGISPYVTSPSQIQSLPFPALFCALCVLHITRGPFPSSFWKISMRRNCLRSKKKKADDSSFLTLPFILLSRSLPLVGKQERQWPPFITCPQVPAVPDPAHTSARVPFMEMSPFETPQWNWFPIRVYWRRHCSAIRSCNSILVAQAGC